ncbi:MAG: hypothetical protein AAB495_02235 [Patescibacteria group bacterium]
MANNLMEILHPRPQNQNLLDQVGSSRPPAPPGYYKGIALDIVAVLVALFSGYLLRLFIGYRQFFLPFLGGVLLLLVISFFGTLLIEGWKRRAFVHLLQATAFVSWFYGEPMKFVLPALGVLFFFLLWGSGRGRSEISNIIEFKFIRIARPVMTKLVSGIALAGVLLSLPSFTSEMLFVSQDKFESTYDSIAKVGNTLYDRINFSSTLGDLVRGIARTQLSQNPLFSAFSPDLQDQVIERSMSQLLDGAGKTIGVPLSSQMSVGEALYTYIISLLQKWKEKLGPTFIAIWAAAVFLAARSIGIFFAWFALLIAYLIYELLSAFNIIHITGESRTREVVEFS